MTPSSPPPPARTSAAERERELRTHLALARSATPVSLVLMIAFTGFDVGYGLWVARAPLGPLLALRAALVAVFALQAVWYRRPAPDLRATPWVWRGSHVAFGASLALAAAWSDGLVSLYPAGLPLGLAAACTWYPLPFRRGFPELLVPAGVAAATLLVATGPELATARGRFALVAWSGIFVSGALYGAAIGHRIWSLQRALYESRDFGRYQLRRQLGVGGMGEVWAAWHTTLRREVALKLLKPSDDPRALARFEREVAATTRLTHPNTIRVFDYGATPDGSPYYAMELLEGESLADRIARSGPMHPREVVHTLHQAARALAEAHAVGIVHRDVKPENLFLARAGGETDFVKLLDFGIAQVVEPGATLTRTGRVSGTPMYLSPEILHGVPATPAADVYSLGATLYFALTGTPPFAYDTTAALLTAHLHAPVQRPSDRVGRSLPEDLENLVLACLAKDPLARPADAARFAERLAACRIGEDAPWTVPQRLPGDAEPTLVGVLLDS